jgi:DNA-binding NtrC family response regulator
MRDGGFFDTARENPQRSGPQVQEVAQIAETVAASPVQSSSQEKPSTMSSATILVVDDEALIRWSLKERLTSEGYTVLEAETGQAALEKLGEGVDLVLLDYRLPDTDGISVLRKIKETEQDVLVILLTAYASVNTADEAMKHGAYHFASKPFNLDEVAAMIERALQTTCLPAARVSKPAAARQVR